MIKVTKKDCLRDLVFENFVTFVFAFPSLGIITPGPD